MSWRMARSLDVLLAEVNAAAPRRNKASDGGIGDAAHATRASDHNPWVKVGGVGVVRARDFTHDPRGGLDAARLAGHLAGQLGKHPALGSGGYVIWNRRIISTSRLSEGWRKYSGINPHTTHVHISVGLRGFDDVSPWGWRGDWFDMATEADLRRIVREEVAPIERRLVNQFRKERNRDRNERKRDKRRFQRLRDLARGNKEMLDGLGELEAVLDAAFADEDDEGGAA